VSANSIDAARILLVSRESSLSRSLQSHIGDQSWQIEQAFNGLEALERVEADSVAVVLLDTRPGDTEALHTLRWLRRVSPELPVILLAHRRNTREALEGLQLGARDCLIKPVAQREFENIIKQYLENSNDRSGRRRTEDQIEVLGDHCSFISASPSMRKLRTQAELLAKVNAPVLIRGESGSGKRVVARLIHKLSARATFRFTEINCAVFPGDSLESELFGYERGAFSGAARGKHGKLELCEQGTILLDEIEEMPASVQAKLLQVLQQKQVYRLGGKTAIRTDVRILAATNGGIDRALADKKLREDLYYCLSAFTLQVPSLRQRKDEIPLLLGYFMDRMATQYGVPPETFSPELVESCQQYAWPGNLRELENFVRRYLIMDDDSLALDDLQDSKGHPLQAKEAEAQDSSPLKTRMRSIKGEAEKNAIAVALAKTHWNRRAAARRLSISYRGLLYKIQQYQLLPPATYPSAFPNSVGSKRLSHGQ
jgi:two-component system, NtrC family, response regulator AtoC